MRWHPLRLHCSLLLVLLWLSPLASLLFGAELGAVRNAQLALSVVTLLTLGWGRRWGLEVALAPSPRTVRWVFAGALVFFLAVQLSRFWAFRVNGFDFSLYDWMLENTWRGRFMYTPFYALNHFSIHQTYLLLPLVPLHALLRTPLLTCVLTALALWGAGLFVFRLTARVTQLPMLALLASVAYFTCAWVGRALDGGFRPEVFYPMLGLGLFDAFAEGRRARAWVFAVLFLCIKEDAALYLTAFCVGGWLAWPARRQELVGMGALALGLFVLNGAWVRPAAALNARQLTPTFVTFWSNFGHSPREIALGMLRRPDRVLGRVLTSHAWELLLPCAALPLLDVAAAPPVLLGVVMLGSAQYALMHGFRSYYPLPIVPFLFAGWARAYLHPWLQREASVRAVLFVGSLLVFPLVGGGYAHVYRPQREVLASLRAAEARLGPTPGPICAQAVLVPHLPYWAELAPLWGECLSAARGTANALVNPSLDPFPDSAEAIQARVARAVEAGRATDLGAGTYLLRAEPP